MTISGGYAQGGSYPAAVDRLIMSSGLASGSVVDLSRRKGVLLAGASLAVTASSGMNLSVGVGQAVLPGGYVISNDTAYTLAVAASGSSARTDLVIARMYDAEAGDASTGPTIEIIVGTTTAVPATPARALALASVAVGASVSSIAAANLTDLRVFTGAAGGSVPIPGAIATPTLAAGLPDGTPVWDATTAQLAVKSGATVAPVYPTPPPFVWSMLPFNANWAGQSGQPVPQYTLAGGRVHLSGIARRSSGTIPSSAELMFSGTQFKPYGSADGVLGILVEALATNGNLPTTGVVARVVLQPRQDGGVRIWVAGTSTDLIWVNLDGVSWRVI